MDAKLIIKADDNGCYLYVSTDDEDILLSDSVITDKLKRQKIVDLVNQVDLRLYAYERYKMAMNAALAIARSRGIGGELETILRDTLHNFGDLSFPGDLNKP